MIAVFNTIKCENWETNYLNWSETSQVSNKNMIFDPKSQSFTPNIEYKKLGSN